MADEPEEMGPVGYLVVEFPGNRMTGKGLPILLDLVDRGLIRILDLLFVRKNGDDTATIAELADLDSDGTLDLAVFEGSASGLLGEDDVAEAGKVLEADSSAALLIYENRWAVPFVKELRQGGAQLVASGFIPLDDIAASLEAAEAPA